MKKGYKDYMGVGERKSIKSSVSCSIIKEGPSKYVVYTQHNDNTGSVSQPNEKRAKEYVEDFFEMWGETPTEEDLKVITNAKKVVKSSRKSIKSSYQFMDVPQKYTFDDFATDLEDQYGSIVKAYGYDDSMEIDIHDATGTSVELADNSVNISYNGLAQDELQKMLMITALNAIGLEGFEFPKQNSITNAKKPVKSGFGDTSQYSVGYDKIKQARFSLKEAWSVLSGTEFENEVGEALSKVTDIMYSLEAKGETLS